MGKLTNYCDYVTLAVGGGGMVMLAITLLKLMALESEMMALSFIS